MFHDRRQRHVERLRQRAYGKARLVGKPRQQRSARRVGERGKGAVERLLRIPYHQVKYRNAAPGLSRRGGGSGHGEEGLLDGRGAGVGDEPRRRSVGPHFASVQQDEAVRVRHFVAQVRRP
jgi:hypothetical protein